MKKIILILIFILMPLFSNEMTTATKIIDKISHALVQKNDIHMLVEDKKYTQVIKHSKYLKEVKSCEKSDIILTRSEIIPKCTEKVLVFATNYLAFNKLPNAIGAFFYQKGRPNIIFRKENLEKHNILLPDELQKYIE